MSSEEKKEFIDKYYKKYAKMSIIIYISIFLLIFLHINNTLNNKNLMIFVCALMFEGGLISIKIMMDYRKFRELKKQEKNKNNM